MITEKNTTALVLDTCFMNHRTSPGHPERPERIEAIEKALIDSGLANDCLRLPAISVDRRWLSTNHTDEYLSRAERACLSGQEFLDCADSSICPESFEVARRATGSVLNAIDAVMEGRAKNAFCAIRPPGHHAEKEFSMGFCLFNNVAIGARYLLEKYNLERVLILDWDVHHGNGTQHSFEEDARVLVCNIHRDPADFYPYNSGFAGEQGVGPGFGFTLNIPLPLGSDDVAYGLAFKESFLPRAREFNPQFILVSAGFDAHESDPLGGMKLTAKSYEWMTMEVLKLADECCEGKVVSMLEGGYNLEALKESVKTHVGALRSDPSA